MMFSLAYELWRLLYACIAGLLISVVFDLFRIKRFLLGSGKVSIAIEDILFWIMAGGILLLLTFFVYHGEIRAYMFVGISIGIFIYYMIE